MPPFDPPLEPAEITAAFTGRYQSVQTLKSGGQGAVFRVQLAPGVQTPAGTDLALKVYYADQHEERTEREVAALQRIESDALVRFSGTGKIELRGVPCVWLETAFIEGESLSDAIARGPLSVQQVATIVLDVANALEPIWSERIVHRDVKPANIMIRPDGHAVLIDLGVARHVELTSLTTVGKTWGTSGYLSPEQDNAVRALTCKSDVFALGIVAQEALLGRHPTRNSQRQLENGGLPTTSLRNDLPPDFASTIDRMVHKDPVRRPTPAEVAAMVQQFTST